MRGNRLEKIRAECGLYAVNPVKSILIWNFDPVSKSNTLNLDAKPQELPGPETGSQVYICNQECIQWCQFRFFTPRL